MKNLIEYTHKLLIERRLLKQDIKRYRTRIKTLIKEAKEAEEIDISNTKEIIRVKSECIRMKGELDGFLQEQESD